MDSKDMTGRSVRCERGLCHGRDAHKTGKYIFIRYVHFGAIICTGVCPGILSVRSSKIEVFL